MRIIPVCFLLLSLAACNKDSVNNTGPDTPSTINITLDL